MVIFDTLEQVFKLRSLLYLYRQKITKIITITLTCLRFTLDTIVHILIVWWKMTQNIFPFCVNLALTSNRHLCFFGYGKESKQTAVQSQIEKWFEKERKKGIHIYNGQLMDLGFDLQKALSKTEVERYINMLSREFDLMLIAEYFDESLLLLRKLMCWSFSDILYIKQNARSKSNGTLQMSESVKEKIRKWNAADVSLYRHFNETFWKKIIAIWTVFLAWFEILSWIAISCLWILCFRFCFWKTWPHSQYSVPS